MDEQLECYDRVSQSDPGNGSQDKPCLFPNYCELSSRRAIEMWTSFLYGQPIWTLRSEYSSDDNSEGIINDDFWALIAVYNLACAYEHYWAQDAALDALNVMLYEHADAAEDPLDLLIKIYGSEIKSTRLFLMLIEVFEYGKFAGKSRLWAEAVNDDDGEEILELKERLRTVFAIKDATESEETGGSEPGGLDKMLPCRNHWHVDHVGPCYLGIEPESSRDENG